MQVLLQATVCVPEQLWKGVAARVSLRNIRKAVCTNGMGKLNILSTIVSNVNC